MQLLIKQRVFPGQTRMISMTSREPKVFVKMNLSRWDTVCMCTMRRIMKLGLSNRNYFAFFRLSKLNGTGS